MRYTKGTVQNEVHVHWDDSGFYTVFGYKNRGDALVHAAKFMDGTDEDTKVVNGCRLRPVRVEIITREVLTNEVQQEASTGASSQA